MGNKFSSLDSVDSHRDTKGKHNGKIRLCGITRKSPYVALSEQDGWLKTRKLTTKENQRNYPDSNPKA